MIAPFPSSKPPRYPHSSFKFMTFFFCLLTCIYTYISRYRYRYRQIYVFRQIYIDRYVFRYIDIDYVFRAVQHWIANWCALPWGKLFPLLSTFLSYLQFFLQNQGLLCSQLYCLSKVFKYKFVASTFLLAVLIIFKLSYLIPPRILQAPRGQSLC